MARRLPRKDVVIIGLGWTGSILAYELSRTGLDVVALERGPWRDTAGDFNIGTAADELRYAVRHDISLRPKQETLTMRNNPSQAALPIRNGAASCRAMASVARACTGTDRPGAFFRMISVFAAT